MCKTKGLHIGRHRDFLRAPQGVRKPCLGAQSGISRYAVAVHLGSIAQPALPGHVLWAFTE
jgi:hypothetical protein